MSAIGMHIAGVAWLVVATIAAVCAFDRKWSSVIFVVMSGVIIGAWRGTVEQQRFMSLREHYGHEVRMSGTVSGDVEALTGGRQSIRLSGVILNGRSHTGAVSVAVSEGYRINRGDRLTLSGVLREGYGSSQAQISHASSVAVHPARLSEVRVRDAFADSVRQAIGEPEASLGIGFLLGQRNALPADVEEAFKVLGLTHIVVASGYNLTILVRIARRSLERVSKFQATAASLGLVGGFVLVTGFSPSMTRAALVTCLAVWAWHYGRRIHPLLLILFTAAVTALWNPFYIWSDVGWYLSFLAFAGVLLLAPLVTYRLFGDKAPPLLQQVLIEALCAQLATLPLILYLFGLLPVLSLPANVLVVPFIPLIMLLTFAAGLTGLVVPAIAPIVGVPAQLLLSYIVTLMA